MMERRLAAVLMADVVGYSRLMEADEAGTLVDLRERRKCVLEPTVRAHGGRIVKIIGDGVLIEFGSAVNAVAAALELQRNMAEASRPLPDDRRIVLRIGINLGDVIGEGADIYGEGVNIAARLEGLSEPGGVCISAKVHDEVNGSSIAASRTWASRRSRTSFGRSGLTGSGRKALRRAHLLLPLSASPTSRRSRRCCSRT